jgi:hypothetical protein
VEDDTQTPYVGLVGVDTAQEDLWRAIGHRSKSICACLGSQEDLGEPKVYVLRSNKVTFKLEHDVLELDVSMSHTYLV